MSTEQIAQSDRLRVEVADATATLTFDAPERLNAVDEEMLRALAAQVRRLDADPAVRVIVLAGEGRGFCSGAALQASFGDPPPTGTLFAVGDVVRAFRRAGTPTVAVVAGVAAGVGVSLALACDYVLASDAATFTLAFRRIGLMPDGAATALVAANVGRARAMRMALTGETVDAATAGDWGLVSEVVATADLSARAAELIASFATGPSRALAATTRAVNDATLAEVDAAVAREERDQYALLSSADFTEGVTAFLEKRPAVFTGE